MLFSILSGERTRRVRSVAREPAAARTLTPGRRTLAGGQTTRKMARMLGAAVLALVLEAELASAQSFPTVAATLSGDEQGFVKFTDDHTGTRLSSPSEVALGQVLGHSSLPCAQASARRCGAGRCASRGQEGLYGAGTGIAPPAWPPAVHMSGHVNGTTNIMGIEIGPVTGPFEMWTSCDPQQPARAKMKITAATMAYGVTVLNTTVAQDCTPTTTTAGKLYENVA